MSGKSLRLVLLAGVASCISSGWAVAQSENVEQVVVTGTLIRGSAPTGSNIVGVSANDIKSIGVTSTIEAINTIPQLTTFNQLEQPASSWAGSETRVNLRNLGNNATLVLVNGHRVVSAGILGAQVDPSVIPTNAVERIDVMPDGGSSVYGSDAVGGVVNIITRTKFDGFQISARDGVADNYNVFNVTAMGGKSWSNGDVMVAYSHDFHTAFFGSQRDYVTANHAATGGLDARAKNCPLANVTANGVAYHYDGAQLVPGTVLCDQTDGSSIYPEERRDAATAYLTERLTKSLTLNVDAIWSRRYSYSFLDAQTAQGAVANGTICDAAGISAKCPQANPYFISANGADVETVSYNYARGLGNLVSPQDVNLYQISPSLVWDVDGNWQVRALYLYGKAFVNVHDKSVVNGSADAAALNGTNSQVPGPLTTVTAVNPYNTAATYGPVLQSVRNWELFTHGIDSQQTFNLQADGVLTSLPGGDLHVAAGAETRWERQDYFSTTGPIGSNVTPIIAPSGRHIAAVFGEALIPLVGAQNAMPGIQSLTVSLSARYDHYSDFGGTFNPRYGITWSPISGMTLRGNYQTAFNAPNLSDNGNLVDTRLQVLASSVNASPTSTRCAGQPVGNCTASTILYAGAGVNLKPQTANTFSYGGDYAPDWFPGFKIGATYWHTSFKSLVAVRAAFNSPTLYTNPAYAGLFIIDPTIAQITALAPGIRVDGPPLTTLFANNPPALIVDARRYNNGGHRIDGVDFSQSYSVDLGDLSLYEQFSGTYVLHDYSSVLATSPFLNNLTYGGPLLPATGRAHMVGSLGATSGPYDGRVTILYSGGFGVTPGLIVGQTHVDSFTTVNFNFTADIGDIAGLGDSQITLDLDNAFDTSPPYWNGTGGTPANGLTNGGFINGGTVGRLFQIGLRTQF